MIILCANTMTPKGGQIQVSENGVESSYAMNYLANFQLLSILSPALRAQPPDRDVRILFGTCSSYIGGQILEQIPRPNLTTTLKPGSKVKRKPLIANNPSAAYGSSKLALMTFASAFQKHLLAYNRPDKQPMNARVIMINPGWCRTQPSKALQMNRLSLRYLPCDPAGVGPQRGDLPRKLYSEELLPRMASCHSDLVQPLKH